MSKCCDNGGGYNPITLFYGNQSIISTNSSSNYVYRGSGLDITLSNSFVGFFNMISNNRVISDRCIYFNGGKIKNHFFWSTIINNTSPYSTGIFYISGSENYFIENCCLLNNFNVLFSCENSINLLVKNCFILHVDTITSGNLITISNELNHNHFFKINTYFSTFMCLTEFVQKSKFFHHSKISFSFNFLIFFFLLK